MPKANLKVCPTVNEAGRGDVNMKESARIGMLVTGFANYPNDVGLKMAREAYANLRKSGLNIAFIDKPFLTPVQGRETAKQLLKQDVCGVILFHGTWTPPAIIMGAFLEIEHLPVVSWGFGIYDEDGRRESTGAIVASTVLRGSLEKMGKKCVHILGLPDDENALRKITVFAKSCVTRRHLRDMRLGLVGYSAMGIYPGMFDHALMRGKIGPEIVHIDTYSLIKRAEETSKAERDRVIALIRKKSDEIDKSVSPRMLQKVAGLYSGIKKLIKEHELNGINVKCQFELSQEYGCICCVPCSLLADENEVVSGCEGDVPLTVTMGIFQYFTGEPANFGDVLEIEGNEVLISSCGYAVFSQAHPDDKKLIRDIGYPGFTGPLCAFTAKEGEVTYARLVEKLGKYYLYMGTGEGIRTQTRQGRMPALKVRLNTQDVQRYWEHLNSHHYAFAYGNLTGELTELCRQLDIEPVILD
jgi:L-fucose isomerase-like protein